MRHSTSLGLSGTVLGVAFGVALGAGPIAAADPDTDSSSPIDTWLYGIGGDGVNTLPGLDLYGSDTAYHGDTPWYTADVTGTGAYYHEVVTKVLDPSFGYPSVGTVADQYIIDIPVNITSQPTDFFDLYSNNSISDPNLGTGDYTTYFDGAFTNFYVSDAAGVEDQVTFGGGPPITVFDFPASDTGSSEAGDWLTQLMSDVFGGAAGSTVIPDLF